MNMQKLIQTSGKVFTGFSILSIGYVSIFSLISPQGTMDLVQTTLPNTDAISSIRGIYGGVGMAVSISLIYLMLKENGKALIFLSLFWGAYAFSRVLTIMIDGELGAFGTQWLMIEGVLCLIGLLLTWVNQREKVAFL
mgnify:CR=1 FL=1